MEPTICEGDHLLVKPAGKRRTLPVAGSIVLALHPWHDDLTIVKRVARADAEGVWLVSDNPALGEDSELFGPLSPSRILGQVTSRIA